MQLPSPLGQSPSLPQSPPSAGTSFWPPLAGEIGVTDRSYVPGDVRRYGAVDGAADSTAGFNLAASAAAAAKARMRVPDGIWNVANVVLAQAVHVEIARGATVRLRQLAALDGSPIFNVTAAHVQITGRGTLDGNKAVQPADGFSDSFNTGGGGLGRAYRAAIAGVSAHYLNVGGGLLFRNTYGACVATLDSDYVSCDDYETEDCNFEAAFIYTNLLGTRPILEPRVTRIKARRTGSGQVGGGAVNSDVVVVRNATNFTVQIEANTFERNAVKLEYANGGTVDFVADTNSVDQFGAVQLQQQATSVKVRGIARNVGQGVSINCAAGPITNVSVDVVVDTTTGTAADGVVVGSGAIDGLSVRATMHAIKRFCVSIQPSSTVRGLKLDINGKTGGLGTAGGILLAPNGGDWEDVTLSGSVLSAPAAQGALIIVPADASKIKLLQSKGAVYSAGAANVAVTESVACVTRAMWDNLVDGISSLLSTAFGPNTQSANYNVVPGDDTILVDATAAPRTVTLPLIARAFGMRPVTVMKIDASANTVTISGNGSNINGAATKVLAAQYAAATLTPTASAWFAK